MGDFNENTNNEDLKSFLKAFQLSSLIKEKTCFKSKQGTNIDLILSNNPKFHQMNKTIETGFSDHHLLVYTMLKFRFIKLPPKCIFYRDYKNFSQEKFRNAILEMKNEESFLDYNYAFNLILNTHASIKKN